MRTKVKTSIALSPAVLIVLRRLSRRMGISRSAVIEVLARLAEKEGTP